MRTHCLTARGARWKTSCVQSEKMPHAQPVQQFADTAGMPGRSHSHWRKGSLTAVGMRARGSQWRKCLTVVVFRIGLIAKRRARTCFVRHPRSDIKLL
jgi:hypothetical protein